MDKLSDLSCIGLNKIESLLDDKSNNKSCLYVRGSSEFNKTVNHIVSLLEDAFLLYKNKSYATSFFISATLGLSSSTKAFTSAKLWSEIKGW